MRIRDLLLLLTIALQFVNAPLESRGAEGNVPSIAIWPDLAPGETSADPGTARASKRVETPPVTRIEKIFKPTVDVFLADDPSGVGVLVLPGGGFNYVVTDKEGSEVAAVLNPMGISVFVLRYRTRIRKGSPGWERPLQDAQRAMKYLRFHRAKWNLAEDKIGLMGFSAGGQVAARLLTDGGQLMYEPMDETDAILHRPDFSMLVYPWGMYNKKTDSMPPEITVTAELPPTFLVHTHDDASSSIGTALFYMGLKKAGVDAELHVYANGGHGYGTRAKPGSSIGSWPQRMTDWLVVRGLADR